MPADQQLVLSRQRGDELLQAALGRTSRFRDGQWEAIDSVVNRGGRTLVVQRTGWGKSAVYFIATRALRDAGAGPTVVISPLLVLMRNQAERASEFGVRAETINSDNQSAWDSIAQRVAAGEIDLLLVSPERLQNKQFRDEVMSRIAASIRLLVIDEAHCVSDWGHDFRPQYRMIRRVVRHLPSTVSVLCTTATANARVVADIEEQFGPDVRTIRGPLARDGLQLDALRMPSPANRLAWLAKAILSDALPGSGIVYVLTRRDAPRVAEWLQSRDISAASYMGGAEDGAERALKLEIESKLLTNELRVVVATQALGMGFDKPDLSWVVHFQRPGSAVLYYQQVGRAGRALSNSYGIVLCGSEDDEINEFFARAGFPSEKQARLLLAKLGELGGRVSTRSLATFLNMRESRIVQFLSILAAEDPAATEQISTQTFRLTAAQYSHPTEMVARISDHRRAENSEMQRYIGHQGCLLEFLQRRLDDPTAQPCGRCARCLGRAIVPVTPSSELVNMAAMYLRRLDIPIEPRKKWSTSRDEQRLPRTHPDWVGNIVDELRAEEGRALCSWSDDGFGRMVREDKGDRDRAGRRYRDELLNATVELIRSGERWPREEPIGWVTVVPSRAAPNWLREFAERVAAALGVPFVDAIRDASPTRQPQKLQENSYHQLRNLDGAFEVDSTRVRSEPALLVDDCVDSGWTLALTAAELRLAGAGRIYPCVLAHTGYLDA